MFIGNVCARGAPSSPLVLADCQAPCFYTAQSSYLPARCPDSLVPRQANFAASHQGILINQNAITSNLLIFLGFFPVRPCCKADQVSKLLQPRPPCPRFLDQWRFTRPTLDGAMQRKFARWCCKYQQASCGLHLALEGSYSRRLTQGTFTNIQLHGHDYQEKLSLK